MSRAFNDLHKLSFKNRISIISGVMCSFNPIAVVDKSKNASVSGDDGPLNSGAVERLEEAFSALQTEFQRYREDKAESDKIYTTTIDQLRKESSEARILNQKLAAQVGFSLLLLLLL